MPNDIVFEHPDWSVLPQVPQNCECGWVNSEGMVIGLHHLGRDQGLRDRMGDVKAVRDSYRSVFAKEGMGLIECDLFDLDGVRAVCAIGKILLQPHGVAFAGTIAVPLPKESYVFNVGAREAGITGMREAAVMAKVGMELQKQGYALDSPAAEPPGQPTGGKPISWTNHETGTVQLWAQDPYEPEYNGPCLRNMADGPEHDHIFAQHPLTRVRVALQSLTEGVRLSTALKESANKKRRWEF